MNQTEAILTLASIMRDVCAELRDLAASNADGNWWQANVDGCEQVTRELDRGV